MKLISYSLSLIFCLICIHKIQVQAADFNVIDYGAVADGKIDSNKAFSAAYDQACQSAGSNVVLVPSGTFLVGPTQFEGPCKGPLEFKITGNLIATDDTSSKYWILFQNIDGLTINGGGSFDGKGSAAWPHNDCKSNPNCKTLPITLFLNLINNAIVRDLKFVDSKGVHLKCYKSQNIKIQQVNIIAPSDSPNTDGIHISCSTNVEISNSNIRTGDDCISMGHSNQGINIEAINCGPSHGISIGSLGNLDDEHDVRGIYVKNCTLKDTTNGVRIKTWAPSNTLSVSNVTYEDLNLINVHFPIIIDQQYCPNGHCKKGKASQVQINNVRYKNIRGSSSSQVAVSFQCSPAKPCENIKLENINLSYNGDGGGHLSASCSNIHGYATGNLIPSSCIAP